MVDILNATAPPSLASASPKARLYHQSHFDSDRMAGSVPVWKVADSADIDLKESPTSVHAHALTENAHQPNTKAPSLSFGEFLDIINPLQHLPVVGNFYRSMTGDTISPVARVVGGAIFGGPIGAAAAIAAAAIAEHSGGETVKTEQAFAPDVRKVAWKFND